MSLHRAEGARRLGSRGRARAAARVAAGLALAAASLGGSPGAADAEDLELAKGLELTADRIEYQRDHELYIAEGGVRILQDGRVLSAHWVAFSNRTRRGVASGEVVFRDGSDVVEAEFVQFHVDTLLGVIFDARFDTGQGGPVIEAAELLRTGEDTYTALDARVTMCRCPDDGRDPWALRAKESDLEIGGYGVSRNTTVEILGVPVVWLPWLLYPVKTERQSGVLFPEIALGGRNGVGFGLPLFWAAHPQINVLATPHYYAERGPKLDLGFDTVYGKRSRTTLFGAYAYDTEIQPDSAESPFGEHRWAAYVGHDQDLPAGVRLIGDVRLVSDNEYMLDFEEFPRERRNRYLESTIYATRHFGADGAVGSVATLQYADDVMNPDNRDRDSFLLQRMPALGVELLPVQPSWLHGLVPSMNVDYVRFGHRRDPRRVYGNAGVGGLFVDSGVDGLPNGFETGTPPGDLHGDDFAAGTNPAGTEGNGLFDEGEPLVDEGHRLLLHPRIGVPVRLFDAVELDTEVGYQQTLYWTEQQAFAERGLLTARAELRTRLVRRFESGLDWLGTTEHVLEPRAGWAYVSSRRQGGNPLFVPRTALPQSRLRGLALDSVVRDPADRISGANSIVFGFGNRLHRVSDSKPRRVWAEFDLLASYDFERADFGSVLFDGRLLPGREVTSQFHLLVDPKRGRIEDGLFAVRARLPRGIRGSVLYRYLRDTPNFFENFATNPDRFGSFDASLQNIHQIGLDVRVPLAFGFTAGYSLRYSLESSLRLANSGTLDYVSRCGCWAAGIQLSEDRQQDLQVQFRYSLLGFGDDIGDPFAQRQEVRLGR